MNRDVVYSMTGAIPIGYAGENEVREIAIDIRPLVRAWPDLAAVLLAKRPGETALYPCVTRVENGVLYWRVTLSDTAIPGKGECVIHMIDGEGRVGKSRAMTTLIERSASGEETQEPPEAIKPWIDDVLASIESVKEGYIEIEQGEENAGLVLAVGEDGRVTLKKGGSGGDGVGVESVEQTQESTESGGENVWTLRLTDGTTSRLIVRNGARGAQGERGERGEQGIPGERGPAGKDGEQGPAGADGSDGEPGKPGDPGPAGEPGKDGSDGVSPITSFERIDGGYRLTIKDAAGTHSVEIMDGVGVQGPAGPQGPEGPAGERGEQGERGAPFAIAKIYASQDAMNAGYATDGVAAGGFVLIETGDVNDEENARLYVKGESRYEYVTDLSGAPGIQGPEGKQGPQGEPGPTGPEGKQGPQGEPGPAGPAGADGKDGAQGPAGPAGSDAAVTATNIQAALGYKPASEAAVSQLSEKKIDKQQGAANVGKILVVGADGNLALADMPATGGDVVGFVDESNNIILSGDLALGTYTVKYEMEDGSLQTIGTIEFADKPDYTNILDVYDIQYNKRFSPSSMGYKDGAGIIAFSIPWADVWNKTLRFKGFQSMASSASSWPQVYAISGSTYKGLAGVDGTSNMFTSSHMTKSGDVYSLPINSTTMSGATSGYDRLQIHLVLNSTGASVSAADLDGRIITIDQEITA